MSPLSLALAVLLAAASARAQSRAEEARKTAPPAERAAPERPAPPQPSHPPLDLWRWFVGNKDNTGAYKAVDLPCQKVHELNNSMSKARQRVGEYEKHRFHIDYLISLGANKKLCMYNDAPTIPADAVLPLPPGSGAEWLRSDSSRQKAADTLAAYYAAANNEDNPLAMMKSRKSGFFTLMMGDVLADDGARTRICQEVDFGPNCASTIASKSLEDLYKAGRAALK